jgi:hypothetical protein
LLLLLIVHPLACMLGNSSAAWPGGWHAALRLQSPLPRLWQHTDFPVLLLLLLLLLWQLLSFRSYEKPASCECWHP